MHELSIAQGLCDQLRELAREQRASRVHRLVLEVGALSNVVPDLLRHAFDALRDFEPFIETAELELTEVALKLECGDCGDVSEHRAIRFQCPVCDGSKLRVLAGEELLLREVELEIEEEQRDERDPTDPRAGESTQVQ